MFQKSKYLKAFAVIAVLAVSLIPTGAPEASDGMPQEPQLETGHLFMVAEGPVEDVRAAVEEYCRPIC